MKADQSLFSGVMMDTVNASVGRTMALEKTINYKGWKGSGYIIRHCQTTIHKLKYPHSLS
ncbi:Uncharacterised protein [Moraxella caprae]|uniref:Uncharacterized protein n=1 Tax=Moraxella caprae TaxID=90240 RepID=A0A378R2L1_9GAMM|nr:Uncharacterised protein [Moraxella caprae]